MFDIKKVEAEARAELAKEQGEKAKSQIKAKLMQIANMEKALANAREEYRVLLVDVGGV